MVIWIASCRASSVVDKGMSMRRQIFGSSSSNSMRSRATRSLTNLFRRSSLPPTRLMPGIGYRQPGLSERSSRGRCPPADHGGELFMLLVSGSTIQSRGHALNLGKLLDSSLHPQNRARVLVIVPKAVEFKIPTTAGFP